MRRVIVADDDRVTSHLICAVLRKAGYYADAAFDVSTTFSLARAGKMPAAILLDMHMPGGDGLDSIREFKRDPILGGVPLIIISGSGEQCDRDAAAALGATLFLSKPVAPASILGALQQVVGPPE
jgi:CheY-like chemotaxis protein